MFGQKVHPAHAVAVIGALVVALDGEHRDARSAQPPQAADGVAQGARVDAAVMKEVAGQHDKIYLFGQRRIDHSPVGAAEIHVAHIVVILPVAQVDIGAVEKACFHLTPDR